MMDGLELAALEERGMADYREGRLEEAIQAFQTARQQYDRLGNQLKSAEMANNLCVALLGAKQPQEALEAVQGTAEVFNALGEPTRTAQAYGNLASALEDSGAIEQAHEAYLQAAQLFEELGDREQRKQTLKALAQMQLKHGKAAEAVASMQVGLEGVADPGLKDRFLRWVLALPARFLKR